MIRITQSMQVTRTLRDQYLNLARMNNYSQDMASGVTLHRPSDDPLRVGRSMRITTELSVNETYKSDLNSANSWVSKTDDSMKTLSSILKRVGELVDQGSNDHLTPEDKQKIEMEIKELKSVAISIANDDYMGRYEFSGYKTDQKFVDENGKYNTNLNLAGLKYEKIEYNIGVGQKTQINLTGVEVFGNEYFGTKTRATDALPFDENLEKTLLGGSMKVSLQKFKYQYKATDGKDYTDPYYKKDPNQLDTMENASKQENLNNEIESNYEKTTTLTQKDGGVIDLGDISFYGNYTKDDINAVVVDLNKSLTKKIDEYISKQGLSADKAKELKTELTQAVQFVNDDGKISLITDRNYAGTVQGGTLNLSEVNPPSPAESTPVSVPNGTIGLTTPINLTSNPVKAYMNFDLKLTDLNNKETNISDIVLAGSYPKGKYTNEQIQSMIANDLKNAIDNKLIANGIPTDTIKVAMDNGQLKLIIDKDYAAQVTENNSDLKKIQMASSVTPNKYTPSEDPTNNPAQIVNLGINGAGFGDGTDAVTSFSFNLDLKKYKITNGAGGEILISNPAVTPVGNTSTKPVLDPKTVIGEYSLEGIGVTKIYSGKNLDGTNKTQQQLLKEIERDINSQITEKAALSKPPFENNGYVKAFLDTDNNIKLQIHGNLGFEITSVESSVTQNNFDTSVVPSVKDQTSSITIPMPQIKDPADTNVYMDLNFEIKKVAKDQFGNMITDASGNPTYVGTPINIDEIKLNKQYPSPADEKQIFEDIKSQIEGKLGELNPPLDAGAVNIKLENGNIVIDVNQDYQLSVTKDADKPSSLSATNFMPNKTTVDQPTREMMPFFEMMDRIMSFLHEGNTKGLSRLLDVVDYHAKNMQKSQGIMGARANMYEVMVQRAEDIKLNYSSLLSDTRDTDYSEVVMKMVVAQNVYRASLSVTAKIIQPSLVDFLR